MVKQFNSSNKTLSVVATPIGNLKDFSARAIETLKSADLILCEDTRSSLPLLNHYEIKKPLKSYYKFNELEVSENLEMLFNEYPHIALISDAGTPGFSDPGYAVVNRAYELGVNVTAIPGACAFITAYSMCGIQNTNFTFLGFLPKNKKEQVDLFKNIAISPFKLFGFYESPLRIVESLKNLDCIQTKTVCVFNDLTKMFERVYRGSLGEVINELEENPNTKKGEYCVIFEVENIIKQEKEQSLCLEALIAHEVFSKNITVKDAIKNLSKDYSKNDLYKASLNLKEL